MVKRRPGPGTGTVAARTVTAHRPVVPVIAHMAGITAHRRALVNTIHMAARTGRVNMRPSQLESRQVVVKRRPCPAAGAVAARAVAAHRPVVLVIARMAGVTVHRRALVNAIHMAARTGRINMCPSQLESRQVVVKRRPGPTAGAVTAFAAQPHATLVFIVILVAGQAVHRRALVNAIRMAARTGRVNMCAGQLKGRQVVIKRRPGPAIGTMTALAAWPHATLVFIVILVAGVAVRWRALINTIHMAARTSRANVRAAQLEGREVMVKIGRFPNPGHMAGIALLPQRSFMRIITGVAAKTTRWCAFVNILQVTALAQHINMRPVQLKD